MTVEDNTTIGNGEIVGHRNSGKEPIEGGEVGSNKAEECDRLWNKLEILTSPCAEDGTRRRAWLQQSCEHYSHFLQTGIIYRW